jgi:hypothetical protein
MHTPKSIIIEGGISNAEPARKLWFFQNWHQLRLNYQILNLPPMAARWPDI